jgi:hypothetical protein
MFFLCICCNPRLGFATKARACKGAGQEWSPKDTFHVLRNVGKCEGMKLHIPKWAPILGVGILMDFWIFTEQFQGSKPIELKIYLYHWKALGTQMSKMGLHDPFGHLKHKLWLKEGSEVKLIIWLPTTKSQELPKFPCMKVTCYIPLESFWWGLQLCFKLHLNQRSTHKVMGPQSRRSPNFGNFGITHLGVSGQNDIWVLVLWPGTKYSIKGKVVVFPKFGRWWILWVRVVRDSSLHQKCSNYALSNLLFRLCKSVWGIDLLVILHSSHLGIPTCPFTPKVLQTRERTPTPSPFAIFTYGLVVESIRESGGASAYHVTSHILP